jgi:apolipoprotein D and lipocalin family protein
MVIPLFRLISSCCASAFFNRAKPAALVPVLLILCACVGGPPGGLRVVDDFDIDRYEGNWFEIARLDHRFERGLSRVTANYKMQPDNTVRVTNRGFDAESQQWKEAIGKARFQGQSDTGALKVSFFGPFYGAYNIVALDQENYQWALITGPSFNYLWILSRQPALDQAIYQQLIKIAADAGFDTDKLIVVEH